MVEVREVADSRFDQAVVIDTDKNRCFIGRMGRAVLMERVRTDRDLMDHLDDFVAVLAEVQQKERGGAIYERSAGIQGVPACGAL